MSISEKAQEQAKYALAASDRLRTLVLDKPRASLSASTIREQARRVRDRAAVLLQYLDEEDQA